MKRLLSLAHAAALCALPLAAAAETVLVLDDTTEGAEAVNAAGRIGLDVVTTRNIAGFLREAAEAPFDIIVFDVARLALVPEVVAALEAHLAAGGTVVTSFHDLDTSAPLRSAFDLTCTGDARYTPLTSAPDDGIDLFTYRERISSPLTGVSRRADEGDYCTPLVEGLTLATAGANPAIVTSRGGQVLHLAIAPDAYRGTDTDSDGVEDIVELYTNLLQLAVDLRAPGILVYTDGDGAAAEAWSEAYGTGVVVVSTASAFDEIVAEEEWQAVLFEFSEPGAIEAGLSGRIDALRANGVPVILSGAPSVPAGFGVDLSGGPVLSDGIYRDTDGLWGEVLFTRPHAIGIAGLGAEVSAPIVAGGVDWVTLAEAAGGAPVVVGVPGGGVVVSSVALNATWNAADGDGDGIPDLTELLDNLLAFGSAPAAPAPVLTNLDEPGERSVLAAALLTLGYQPLLIADAARFAAVVPTTSVDVVGIETLGEAPGTYSADVAGAVGLALADGAGVVVAGDDLGGASAVLAVLGARAPDVLATPDSFTRNATHLGRIFSLPQPVPATFRTPAAGGGSSVALDGSVLGSVVARFGSTAGATLQTYNGRVLVNGFAPSAYAGQDDNLDRVPDAVELVRNQFTSVLSPQTAVVADSTDRSVLAEAALRAGLATMFVGDSAALVAALDADAAQQVLLDSEAEALLQDADVQSALSAWRDANRALVLFPIGLHAQPGVADFLGVEAVDRSQLRNVVESVDAAGEVFRSPNTVPSPLTNGPTPYADLGDHFDVGPEVPVAARYAFNTGVAATVFLDGGTTALNGFATRQLLDDDLDEDGVADRVEFVMNQIVRVGRVPVAVLDVPTPIAEGASNELSAARSFDPFDEALTFAWDLDNDGDFDDAAGSTASFNAATIDGDGTTTFRSVALRVTNASGLRAILRRELLISNVPPRLEAGANRTVDQGTRANFTVAPTDVAGDPITVTWDPGDGSLPVTGASISHQYATVGDYLVTVTAADDDGGVATDTFEVTYRNIAPAIEIGTYGAIDEGGEVTVAATTSDPGDDAHSVSWTFGDGGTGDGSPFTYRYPDSGTFVITGTARETADAGVSRSDTASIVVRNVAPSFVSVAPTTAEEGVEYAYDVVATDPGADTLAYALLVAPAGMTVDAAGAVRWVPGSDRFTDEAVRLRVTDDDGASAVQEWTIAISFVDSDGGGAPDSCELLNELDPDDDADDDSDVDGDGLPAYAECISGTDPSTFSGPPAPELVSPIARATWTSGTVILTWNNVDDPDGDDVRYEVEVHDSELLDSLIASAADVAEEPSATSRTSLEARLFSEDSLYWWRARAVTDDVTGPWSEAADFVYNLSNEAPSRPVILAPIGTSGRLRPTLQIQNAADPEGEVLTYSFEVFAGSTVGGTAVFSATEVAADDDGTTEVDLDVDLTDGETYTWRTRATDSGRPRRSGPYAIDTFVVNTANDAPTAPAPLSPIDGERVPGDGVTLRWQNATDADGDPIRYDGALARDEAFGDIVSEFSNVAPGTDGTTRVAIAATLDDGVGYWWRVRASDGELASEYGSAAFATVQPNRRPEPPVPLSPISGAEVGDQDGGVVLTVQNAVDPDDGQLITYDFQVALDSRMDDLLDVQTGVLEGSGEATSTTITELPYGPLFWRARANDGETTSNWSEIAGFRHLQGTVTPPDAGVDAGPDAEVDAGGDSGRPSGYDSSLGGGAGCTGAGAGPSALALFGLVALLRRRRVTA